MGTILRDISYALRNLASARGFTAEIGVRMALGADRRRVIGLVLGGAFRRVIVGLLLGLPLAVGTGYLLSAQLYGVKFWDPVALSVATGSLTLAALIASVVPAMRALRTN